MLKIPRLAVTNSLWTIGGEVAVRLLLIVFCVWTSAALAAEHPYLLVTGHHVPGLRSLAAVRRDIKEGRSAMLWRELRAKVDKEIARPLVIAGTNHNRSYKFVATACNRITDVALVALITNERRYAEASLAQIEVLFDEEKWPEWSDQAHLDAGLHSDLRHGQFARAIGFAYDWVYQLITPEERQRIVAGLDRRAIKPFKASIAAKEKWITRQSNWKTSVVGGFAILGMSLGDDHPEGKWLVEFADPLMDKYMEIFGPNGEFNENPGYASSVRFVVDHYQAMHYASGGREKPDQLELLRAFSKWILYCISPPKRMLAFGDAQTSAAPNIAYFGALASVLRDSVIQWTYLRYVGYSSEDARPRAQELLGFDPTVPAVPPVRRLPLAQNFPAQSGIVTSRSSWDPVVPISAVWSKSRTEDVHRHADWGQVCIDGFGERLIVDLGSPPVYPKTGKRHYYNYQQIGHNVLAIGDDEYDVDWRMRRQGKAYYIATAASGAAWSFELSEVYAQDRKVRRHIVHLLPRIVVVLDEATLPEAERIRLRWHTSTPAKSDEQGRFSAGQRGVKLTGQVMSLSGD
ncbi:MAG: heparinase II/III domain-containing protein, partial [Limisphaerales bacterium]